MRVLGPQFGDTVHISEVIGAKKVKFDVQVAIKELRPHAEIVSLESDWKRQCPQLRFFKLLELSQTSGARKAHIRVAR